MGVDQARVRWTGSVTFLSIVTVFLSDMGLMGLPVSGAELAELGLAAMVERPPFVLYLSSFGALGILGLTAGSLLLYEGIKPIGPRRALPPIMLLTFFWWLGCTVHFSYGYIGDAMQIQAAVDGAAAEALQRHIENVSGNLFLPLWGLSILCLASSSIWLAVLIMRGGTHFPRWYAVCLPFFTILAGLLVSLALPAPIGGYAYPAFVHLGTPITFGLAIVLLRRVPSDRPG